MKCPNCGRENYGDSRFCEYCGQPLPQEKQRARKRGRRIALLCGVWAAVLVALLLLLLLRNRTDSEEDGDDVLHNTVSTGESACPSAAFADVDTSRWYHAGVDFVLQNGYMAGTGQGFQPDAVLTREMLAQILYAREGKPEIEITGRFSDVDTSRWYAAAVEWAAAEGYFAGYANGSFGVGDAVTREQIAVVLYAYSGKPAVRETALDSFPDAEQIFEWARAAMVWAVENGLIAGNDKGELMPSDAATRATFAVIFYAYLEK